MTNKVLQPLFIGYSTLEELYRVLDPKRPVYAALITEPGKPNQYDQRVDALVIMVAQPDGDLVNYCRLPVGRINYVGRLPLNGQADEETQKTWAEQAKSLVDTWLTEGKLAVLPGVISVPQNMRWLDGWANFLFFDNSTQTYCRK